MWSVAIGHTPVGPRPSLADRFVALVARCPWVSVTVAGEGSAFHARLQRCPLFGNGK